MFVLKIESSSVMWLPPQDGISSPAVKQLPQDWGMILEMLFMMYQPKE